MEESSDPTSKFTSRKGTMIMKSVSLFITHGRHVSNFNRLTKSGQGPDSGGDNEGEVKKIKKQRKSKGSEDSTYKLTSKSLEFLRRKTHFSKDELIVLSRIYKKLLSNCHVTSQAIAATTPKSMITESRVTVEGLDRIVLRELLHATFDILTDEIMIERIYLNWDKAHEGQTIRLEGWILGLSIFLRGTLTEQIEFCFRIYDLNGDGFITKDEIFTLMRDCLIKQPQDDDPDECVKEFVEIVLKKFDFDKDGKISFEDFSQVVAENKLLLEAFGQCLPTEIACSAFSSTLIV